jgi:hypothetical protein
MRQILAASCFAVALGCRGEPSADPARGAPVPRQSNDPVVGCFSLMSSLWVPDSGGSPYSAGRYTRIPSRVELRDEPLREPTIHGEFVSPTAGVARSLESTDRRTWIWYRTSGSDSVSLATYPALSGVGIAFRLTGDSIAGSARDYLDVGPPFTTSSARVTGIRVPCPGT